MARTKDEKLRKSILKLYFQNGERKIDISKSLDCAYSTVLKVIKEKIDLEKSKQG